jgi:transitional endoplasmic reticulum ATPase
LKSRGNVIVIAATDRIDLIDPAFKRPGRFDEIIEIHLPEKEECYEILKIHTRTMPLAENVELMELAEMTVGFTGADLMALCKKAAMKSLRRLPKECLIREERIPQHILDKINVTMEDFLDALKELKLGDKN